MNETFAIQVNHVSVRFNLANQKIDSLKEYCIRLVKRQLMFQEFFALKDVSFCVKPGEAWGLIGANGSGKSTMLKLICGIFKPYSGKVIVNGDIAPLIELGAGFDNELSGRENIFLNGAVLGHSRSYMEAHFAEITEFAGLGQFLDSPVKNYSSGMKARLGFSIATMIRPRILVVDEILAVGDAEFQKKCYQRMEEMLSGGTTLLFVSHSDAMVRRLCSHAIWLDKGCCIAQGEVNEVCDAYEKGLQ